MTIITPTFTLRPMPEFTALEELLAYGQEVFIAYQTYHTEHAPQWPEDEIEASMQIMGLLSLLEIEVEDFITQKLTINSPDIQEYLVFAKTLLEGVQHGIQS